MRVHRILPSGDDRSVREKYLGLEVRASPPAAERGVALVSYSCSKLARAKIVLTEKFGCHKREPWMTMLLSLSKKCRKYGEQCLDPERLLVARGRAWDGDSSTRCPPEQK